MSVVKERPCSSLMEICYLRYAIWEMHILTDGVWDGCCSQSKTQVDVIFGWGILKDENGQENKGSLRNEDAWDSLFWIIVPRGIAVSVWEIKCWHLQFNKGSFERCVWICDCVALAPDSFQNGGRLKSAICFILYAFLKRIKLMHYGFHSLHY